MEFKLNKIDTDIRKRMQEEIKDDKIHSAKGIRIKKDDKDKNNLDYGTNENKEKKYITIDGIKYDDEKITIKAEKFKNTDDEIPKGRILDTKK